MNKKNLIGYQIFPATFCDTNGTGFGDIKGITSKIRYLKSLGVDFLYLNPIYLTHFDDSGYDVDNYYKIDPRFGTMKDIDKLIKKINENGMFIMMDLVLNHTSENHIWFKKALQGELKYKDFYIWRDSTPPLKNKSIFGGTAWEYVPKLKSWYLHTFAKSQPDLNWENDEMVNEFYKCINFWIKKGIKGFRLDAVQYIGKDIKKWKIINGPKMKQNLLDLYKNTYGKKDIFTIGESYHVTNKIMMNLTKGTNKSLDAYMNFGAMGHDWSGKYEKYTSIKPKVDAKKLKYIFKWQKFNTLTVNNNSNHDQPRIMGRYWNEHINEQQTAFNAMLIGLRGIPLFYYGEELGTMNVKYNSLKEFNDTTIKSMQKHYGLTNTDILKGSQTGSRDLARGTFPWDKTINGGFTKGKTIFKTAPNFEKVNQKNAEKNIVFKNFKKLIKLRKKSHISNVLTSGKFKIVNTKDKNILAWIRKNKNHDIYIAINFSTSKRKIKLPKGDIIFNSHKKFKEYLEPFQVVFIEKTKSRKT